MATRRTPAPKPEPTPEPTPEPAPAPAAREERPSVLERLRRNRVGSLTVGLVVALAVGLLLSVLVPDEPELLGYLVLGGLLTLAVGFSVRYVSQCRGLKTQAIAFVSTALGAHVMITTGAVNQLGDGALPEMLGDIGPSYDDALLIALGTPAISSGLVLAGLLAAIIAGWGERTREGASDAPTPQI